MVKVYMKAYSLILPQGYPVAAPGFKKWGGKKGATIDYGGANMCA